MKNGNEIPCTIDKIENNIINYTRESNDTLFFETINLIQVAKYTLSKTSEIEPNIEYRSEEDEDKAASNILIYEGIVYTDSARKVSDLFETAKNWFSTPFPDVLKKTDYVNSEVGQINGQFSIRYLSDCKIPACIRCSGIITFKATILIKDGKYRYIFENFEHKVAEQVPGGPISFGKITTDDSCPYKIKGVGANWNNERWDEIQTTIEKNVTALIQDLKNLMGITIQNQKW